MFSFSGFTGKAHNSENTAKKLSNAIALGWGIKIQQHFA
jgi:hypothetical protein